MALEEKSLVLWPCFAEDWMTAFWKHGYASVAQLDHHVLQTSASSHTDDMYGNSRCV
jgi:hypothetical protein